MNQSLQKVTIGNSTQKVSRIGLGCMNLSFYYEDTSIDKNPELGVELIGKALEQGINFFDTAFIYSKNEELLAQAMKKYGREKFFLATKVPHITYDQNLKMQYVPRTKEHIKEHCYKSLKRLEIDQIDLLYQHRVDPKIPIETQAEAFKELIEEGKIKYYGLCEASEDSIRRAHKIHPITAIQSEYSLFTRDVEENGVLKACKELGIAFVPYSPLGRGILSGTFTQGDKLGEKDLRRRWPRFSDENFQKNLVAVQNLKEMAQSLSITPSQLALSWLLAQGSNIIPIPGTKREKYLLENIESTSVNLTQETLKTLSEMFPYNSTHGERYPEEMLEQEANTKTVSL